MRLLTLLSVVTSISVAAAVDGPCYRGGMDDMLCEKDCPPCWKEISQTEAHCFEYNKNGRCLFDWVDMGKGSHPTKPSISASHSSSSTDSSPTSTSSPIDPSPTDVPPSQFTSTFVVTSGPQRSSTSTIVHTVKRPYSDSGNSEEVDSGSLPINSYPYLLSVISIVLSFPY